uniref:Uncharacterized protein n=1 Tax=Glossina palpalis gambiensis TaxID=67801 RepID=A0A1B0BXP8_9MUSC
MVFFKLVNVVRCTTMVFEKRDFFIEGSYFLLLLPIFFADIFSAFQRGFRCKFYKLNMKHDIVDLLCSRVHINEPLRRHCLKLNYLGRKLKKSATIVHLKILNKYLALCLQYCYVSYILRQRSYLNISSVILFYIVLSVNVVRCTTMVFEKRDFFIEGSYFLLLLLIFFADIFSAFQRGFRCKFYK